MNSIRLAVAVTFLALAGWSSTAFAQKIRTYTKQAESSNGGGASSSSSGGGRTAAYYPGPPAPQRTQQQAQGQGQGQGQGKEDKDLPKGSFVTVFAPEGSEKPVVQLNLPPEKLYHGVIPGQRDDLPMLDRARKKGSDYDEPNTITWIGFQPKDDVTRVFLQTAREAKYSLGHGNGVLTLTFSDTKIPLRNFSRFIDTSFFDRVVTRIEAKQSDDQTVVVTIQLRESEEPEVAQTDDYVYVDFPYTPPQTTSTQDSDDDQ